MVYGYKTYGKSPVRFCGRHGYSAIDRRNRRLFSSAGRSDGTRRFGSAGLYYITVYILGVGFGIGVQILIARLNGSGHYQQIAPLFIRLWD